jgi:diadenosine tetraphosphate (Ap4A) HIT family hydrolase
MSETAEQIYERAMAAADAEGRLPMPPVEEWDTFPFEGDLRVRPLLPPADEPPRLGESGPDDCWRCKHGDAGVLWRDERWRVVSRDEPFGLPVVVILETREHMDLPDLSDELAAEFGRHVVRIERAVRRVGNIGRVHVGRWGDGSAHFHAWFMGRPARLPQVRMSFAAIWDDILPPTPEPVWRENLATVARELAAA